MQPDNNGFLGQVQQQGGRFQTGVGVMGRSVERGRRELGRSWVGSVNELGLGGFGNLPSLQQEWPASLLNFISCFGVGQIISDFIPVGASAEKFFHFLTEELLLIDGMKIRGEPTPRSFNSYPLHVKGTSRTPLNSVPLPFGKSRKNISREIRCI